MAKVHDIPFNIKSQFKSCTNCKVEDNLKLCKYCNKEFCHNCFNLESCNNCKDNIVIVKRSNRFSRWLFSIFYILK